MPEQPPYMKYPPIDVRPVIGKPTIVAYYECDQCKRRGEVRVRARTEQEASAEGEERDRLLCGWVNGMAQYCGDDHALKHPQCSIGKRSVSVIFQTHEKQEWIGQYIPELDQQPPVDLETTKLFDRKASDMIDGKAN
jgi:hypothetical protein